MKGTVSRVSWNEWKGKKLWSFSLEGRDEYFNTGIKKPPVQEGDYIEFQADDSGNGRYRVDVDSISAADPDEDVEQPTKKGSVRNVIRRTKPTMSKDDYWNRKEERDIEVQRRIEIQSCRNSALQLVSLLFSSESVKLPAAAKREEFITTLIDKYTAAFIVQNQGGVKYEPVVEQPKEKTKKKASEDEVEEVEISVDPEEDSWN